MDINISESPNSFEVVADDENDDEDEFEIDDLIVEEGSDDEISKKEEEESNISSLPAIQSSSKKEDNVGTKFVTKAYQDSSEESSLDMGGGNKVNLKDVSLSGKKNYFLKRLTSREPELFITKDKGNFKSFQTGCPWQFKKFPVILSKEEKKYIDEKDGETGTKSYDEFLTYGSKDTKNHYICPRYWCLSDEKGKSRSLNLEQVNKGECGGWDAVIPQGAKKVPKGKRIFEFSSQRFNRPQEAKGISNLDNPLMFKKYYPSYQDPAKHQNNLCVPCCFNTPSSTTYGEYTYDPVKKNFVNSNGAEVDVKTIPKLLEKYAWKPIPNFTRTQDGNIDLLNVEGVKESKPIPKKDRINMKLNCDQNPDLEEEKKTTIEGRKDNQSFKKIQLNENKPLYEAFPLKRNQTGYLTLVLQKFLNYDTTQCFKNNAKELKDNHFCLLRLGVEKNSNKSLLFCIASVKQNMENSNKLIKLKNKKDTELIKEYINIQKKIKNVSLDQFITLQNGSLIDIFSSKREVNINKYKNTNIYKNSKKNKNWREYLQYICTAYENYKNYLKKTDCGGGHYEYIWDLICSPKRENGVVFENGINLIILERNFDSMNDRINIICPKSIYSTNVFYDERPTVILYTQNNVFEVITLQKLVKVKKRGSTNKEKKLLIKQYFEKDFLQIYSPELEKKINIIKNILNNECKTRPGLPNVYNYYENKYLKDILKIFDELDIEVLLQLINLNTQVIGIVINYMGNELFIPVRPSKIIKDINYVFFDERYVGLSFENTVQYYNQLKQDSNEELFLNIRALILEDKMIVGLITETNQFVPVIPEIYDSLKMNPEDNYEVIETGIVETKTDNSIMSTNIDEEVKVVKFVELESNFYNAFRNVLKILLKDKKYKIKKNQLLELIKENTDYISKIKSIIDLLRNILNEHVDFIDLTEINQVYQLENVYTCLNFSGSECSKKSNCVYDNETCKLLIPNKNLMGSSSNNNTIYYNKLADQLIRFPKIRDYIFISDKFLTIGKTNYNLTKNEILLIEEFLFGDFLRNITIRKINKYIKFNNNYDYAIPKNSKYNFTKNNTNLLQKYNNNNLIESKMQVLGGEEIKVEDTIVKNNIISEIKECINEEQQLNKSNFDELINLKHSGISLLEFKRMFHCSFIMMSYIISFKEKSSITVNMIKNVLIDLIRDLVSSQKKLKIIKETFYLSNKHELYELFDNIDSYEVLINHPNYYLTELEIFLLCEHYNINLTMVSKNYSFIKKGVKIVENNINNSVGIILLIDNYYVYDVRNNKYVNNSPIYSFIEKNELTFIKKELINSILKKTHRNYLKLNSMEELLEKYMENFKNTKRMKFALDKVKSKYDSKQLNERKQQNAGSYFIKKSKQRVKIK